MLRWSGFDSKADREGFLLVAPEGTGNPRGWYTGFGPGGSIDDVGFIGALIDFIIIAFVVWRISKALLKPAPAGDKPATRECPYCRSSIDARATRCAHCTATLERAA